MTLDQLRLDKVSTLLQQAGVDLPEQGSYDDAAYLQRLLDALCDLSSTDFLTGLQNRRAFLPVLERELDRVARGGEQALLLAVDIDHFKRVNDTHGHLVGDRVIQSVAQALKRSVRPMDTVARIGGEEFCLVFPNCPASFAQVVAERVRHAVDDSPLQLDSERSIRITVSCGGAFATPWVRGDVTDWLSRADQQLYLAKQEGRNRVALEEVLAPEVSPEEKGLLFGWNEADPLIIENSRTS